MPSLNRVRALGILALATLTLAAPAAATAATSLPSPRWYWDSNNDEIADAGAYTVRTAGDNSYWTSGREARITSAVATWAATQWNPSANLTAAPADCGVSLTCQGLWIDGTQPPASCGGNFVPGELAVNCVKFDFRDQTFGPNYFDIKDSDIYINTTGSGPTWTYSSTGSSSDTIYDFQGVLTHEIGHAILLIDLGVDETVPPCAPGGTLETMCGYVYKGWQSTQQRSLVTDDITSVNAVY